MKKSKRLFLIGIIGMAGAGKDTSVSAILEKDCGHSYYVPTKYTSRPRREGEQDGEPYYFLSAEEMENKKDIISSVYNDWHYGFKLDEKESRIAISALDLKQVCEIVNIHPEIHLSLIYLHASDKERLMRQLQREENPNVKEIVRRFNADSKEFNEETLRSLFYEATPVICSDGESPHSESAIQACNLIKNFLKYEKRLINSKRKFE